MSESVLCHDRRRVMRDGAGELRKIDGAANARANSPRGDATGASSVAGGRRGGGRWRRWRREPALAAAGAGVRPAALSGARRGAASGAHELRARAAGDGREWW